MWGSAGHVHLTKRERLFKEKGRRGGNLDNPPNFPSTWMILLANDWMSKVCNHILSNSWLYLFFFPNHYKKKTENASKSDARFKLFLGSCAKHKTFPFPIEKKLNLTIKEDFFFFLQNTNGFSWVQRESVGVNVNQWCNYVNRNHSGMVWTVRWFPMAKVPWFSLLQHASCSVFRKCGLCWGERQGFSPRSFSELADYLSKRLVLETKKETGRKKPFETSISIYTLARLLKNISFDSYSIHCCLFTFPPHPLALYVLLVTSLHTYSSFCLFILYSFKPAEKMYMW